MKNSVETASGFSGGPFLADFDLFGYSIAALGDVNGDGVEDLAAGVLNDDTGEAAAEPCTS